MNKYHIILIVSAFVNAVYIAGNRFFLTGGINVFELILGSSLVCLVLSIILITANKDIRKIKTIGRKNIVYIILLGLMTSAFAKLLFYTAQSLVAAINASFLIRISPIFSILISYFFLKEKVSRKQLAMIMIMILGVYLFVTKGHFGFNVGDILLIIVSMTIAIDHNVSRSIIRNKISPHLTSSMMMIVGAIVLFAVLFPFTPLYLNNVWIYTIVGLLVFLSITTRNLALTRTKAYIVSSVLLLSPMFTSVIGIAFLQEMIFPLQLIGGALILFGSYYLIKKKE